MIRGVNRKSSKSVIQYDMNNNVLNIFYSIKNASRMTGIDYRLISRCCNKKISRTFKYRWSFEKDKVLGK